MNKHHKIIHGNSTMPPEAKTLSMYAPAKLNLALHVTGQRSDGYHLLDSLVNFTAFGDQLHLSASIDDEFSVSGPYQEFVPRTADNLVLRARDALRAIYPQLSSPVAIHLEKNLPVASGIGGGSSDAAATILLLARLWNLPVKMQQLLDLGLQLGADVPMCLYGQTYGGALQVKAIGEDLHHLAAFPALPILLVNDGSALTTPQIFRNLNKRDNLPLPAAKHLTTLGAVCEYLQQTRNDLWQPASDLLPNLTNKLQLLYDQGAQFAQMSGSGPTCFGIFTDLELAQQAAINLKAKHPDWFICPTSTLPPRGDPDVWH